VAEVGIVFTAKEDTVSTTMNVTVPVPSERVSDFYRWFADWTDGHSVEAADDAPRASQPDLDAAVRWWRLLKPGERRIFGVWIDAAPEMVTAGDIIDQLGLKGPREIPGILSWTGRKGHKVGFPVRWSFRYDPTTEEPLYGIEDNEYASLIREARSAAEGG
jgi:hypothetical protein